MEQRLLIFRSKQVHSRFLFESHGISLVSNSFFDFFLFWTYFIDFFDIFSFVIIILSVFLFTILNLFLSNCIIRLKESWYTKPNYQVKPVAVVVVIVWWLDLQLLVQSVRISTTVVNWHIFHVEMYSIQLQVIMFVSDLQQVGGFHRVPRFPPPIKLTATI